MKSYRIVEHSGRSAAPVELVAEMARDERVEQFCRDRLAASTGLVSIEIWSQGRQLCHLWSETRRAA
ncbi:MAG TPA: hypothetical protein VFE13_05425 [Caulobacteraceae bacterium]|jgi:hypothetical protein|nr:hypothetical protein [Caulobacteraceae bacterium]